MIRKSLIAILTLLTVTTAAVGVASSYHDSRWPFLTRWYYADADTGFVLDIQTHDGSLGIKCFSTAPKSAGKRSPPGNEPAQFLGVSYEKTDYRNLSIDDGDRVVLVRGPNHLRHTIIPIWYLAVLFAVCPIFTCVRGFLRRRRRQRKGLCPECGYDLRGNVSGRCPECGKPVPVAIAVN